MKKDLLDTLAKRSLKIQKYEQYSDRFLLLFYVSLFHMAFFFPTSFTTIQTVLYASELCMMLVSGISSLYFQSIATTMSEQLKND